MFKKYFNLSKEDATEMGKDIVRALTQAVIVHMLTYAIDNDVSLFDEKHLKKFLYITISMLIYTFITKRIFLK